MNHVFRVILIAVLVVIFSPWFLGNEIIGGDWPYFYGEMLRDFNSTLPLWSSFGGLFGGVNQNFPLYSYQYGMAYFFVNTLGLPWPIVYKTFWFALFILVSMCSIIFLMRTMFGKINFWKLAIGIILYTCNTYILMIVGGGQLGIAISYAIAPLIVGVFIRFVESISSINVKLKIVNSKLLNTSIILGLLFSFQSLFDIRIIYLTLLICGLYFLFHYFLIKKFNFPYVIFYSLVAIFIVLGLHAYWLFPFLSFNLFFLPPGITSAQGFNFFSFADFSHAFSFLHPNWPENIFGKIYFLKPEFIMLPIIAFSSLFFINSKFKIQNSKLQVKSQKFTSNSEVLQVNNKIIVFFVLLGLLGTFLAKGTNPPFGVINECMFLYIPGMSMFRDPTKFYLLIALSYSILIPFSIKSMYEMMNSKFKIPYGAVQDRQSSKLLFKIQNFIPQVFLLFTFTFLLFLIRPALLGELGGTFKSGVVPKEYIELKNFLHSDSNFSRTLWIPTQSRFRYQSENHPLVTGEELFKTSSQSAILALLKKNTSEQLLERLGIKYVIIPYDTTGEIFVEDRKYNAKKRDYIEKELDTIPWLSKIQTGNISVYKTPKHNDHFWIENSGKIEYKRKSNSEYELNILSLKPSTILFSERFHPGWNMLQNGKEIKSIKTQDGLNSFRVPEGSYTGNIFFKPQQYTHYSYLLSFVLLIVLLLYIIKERIRRN